MVNVKKQKVIYVKSRHQVPRESRRVPSKRDILGTYFRIPCFQVGSGGAEGRGWQKNEIHSGVRVRTERSLTGHTRQLEKAVSSAEVQVR